MSKIYVDEIAGIASPSTVAIPGHVINVQLHSWNNETNINTTSWTDATGSSFTYTPLLSSSSLIITTTYSYEGYDSNGTVAGGDVRLVIDGSAINSPDGYGTLIQVTGASETNVYGKGGQEYSYTHGSTSALTIKLQLKNWSTTYDRFRVNPSGTGGYYSSIKVMEIAG